MTETEFEELELTPASGEGYDLSRIRSDVEYLRCRDLKVSRFFLEYSYDKNPWNCIGIDSMSFVMDDPEDQMVAYSFSRYWVGRVRII